MKIAVIGAGPVGLVSSVCLAMKGHFVICVDIDWEKVKSINRADATIYEPYLQGYLRDVIHQKRFFATVDIDYALESVDVVIVAVGTPTVEGQMDRSALLHTCHQIGNHLRKRSRFLSVVIKSTVLPSTTDTFVKDSLESVSGKKLGSFGLGMNPEFLREGHAVEDFLYPDRIILGYEDPLTLEILKEMYAPWSSDKILVNTRTAEMIKYANNCMLALQISCANELANLAWHVGGIDYKDVLKGVFSDKRWNPIQEDGERVNPEILTYLTPGPGFGGSCFSKDVRALEQLGGELGLEMSMLNSLLKVNSKQPLKVVEMLESYITLQDKKILVLGLSFKPGTDDVRESASIFVIEELLRNGCKVSAHDPMAIANFKKSFGDVETLNYTNVWQEEIDSTDIILIMTKWPEYLALKTHNLEGKLVFDTRGLFNKEELQGARTISIGSFSNNPCYLASFPL